MNKYKIFDVVELNNGNKATILTNEGYRIKIEEVNSDGTSIGVKEIDETDIKRIIQIK